MLVRYKGLPFFRMSACNAGRHPFDRLTDAECVAVASEAIGLINRYADAGFAVTVDRAAFNRIVTRRGFVSTPYELCCWMCLIAAGSHRDHQRPGSGLQFFFEEGFSDQSAALKMMHRVFASARQTDYYGAKSYTFVPKDDCRPAQAADLLAWQWFKDLTRRANGKATPRGDLKALLAGTPHSIFHADADRLQDMVDKINAIAGTPVGNEIAGLALTNPRSLLFPKRPGDLGSKEEYLKLVEEFKERF